MDLFSIFRSKKCRPSLESTRAKASAERSHVQATEDLRRTSQGYVESQHVNRELKAHNTANQYDDWLCEQFLKYYK